MQDIATFIGVKSDVRTDFRGLWRRVRIRCLVGSKQLYAAQNFCPESVGSIPAACHVLQFPCHYDLARS